MKTKWIAYPYILWMIIFIIVPLALILVYSLTTGEGDIRNIQFTLDNFKKISRSYIYRCIVEIHKSCFEVHGCYSSPRISYGYDNI